MAKILPAMRSGEITGWLPEELAGQIVMVANLWQTTNQLRQFDQIHSLLDQLSAGFGPRTPPSGMLCHFPHPDRKGETWCGALDGAVSIFVDAVNCPACDALEEVSIRKHWLLFSASSPEPIGCTRGPDDADEAVRQALPEKEWSSHRAVETDPMECQICCEGLE